MSKVVAKTVSVQNSAGTATTDITFDGTKLVNTALDNAIEVKANTYDLGVGQTWQDVTASRALGVTYTNSTGKPILINVWATSQTASIVGMQIIVDGSCVDYAYTTAQTYTQVVINVSAIIPIGKTYRVDYVTTLPSSVTFMELR